ncbi:MAG: isoprenylcysteine carboxylmethyltransferase family protein [Acidobacteriota bacterium]
MSLIPVFKIGVWNAWIFLLYPAIHPLIMMLIIKNVTKKMESHTYNKAENIIFVFTNIILFFGMFICSVFLPLQLGTIWFYAGLVLCISGIILWTMAMVNIADIPPGEAWTRGLYRYSRHPMVLSSFLIFIGAGFASASWVLLLFSIVFIIMSTILVAAEERSCLEKFGAAYDKYMNNTPKWIGIPGSTGK